MMGGRCIGILLLGLFLFFLLVLDEDPLRKEEEEGECIARELVLFFFALI